MKGGPFGEKKNLGKKVSQCRKTERGFLTSILSQNIKKLKGENFYFRKKISQCRKKLKGGPFGILQHPFCGKTAKKLKEGPFGEKKFFEEKVSQFQKK